MSGAQAPAFRRLVLEMALGGVDTDVMRFAAEFAHAFGIDMHGVYIEDESLLHLAELPFSREIRLPTHDWRPLDAVGLADDLRQQAETERGRLRRIAAAAGVRGGFEVRRGEPAACVAGLCSVTDIVAVVGSAGTARPYMDAVRLAVARSPASALFLPDRIACPTGRVAVVVADLNDPAFGLASRVARALGVAPVVVLADGSPGHCPADPGAEDMARALAGTRERLIVVARGLADTAGASRLAALRHAAVLAL